jgi:uncharacterized membrane protein YhaH (DUF805 family)
MDYAWFLFRSEGRINRGKYWLAMLIILCWMMFVLMLLAAIGSIFGIAGHRFAIDITSISASFQFAGSEPSSKSAVFPQIVTFPMTLLFAWCYLAASIKRLHDRNKSGWWMLPFFAAPGLYDHFEGRLGDSYAAALVGLAVFVVFIWGYVEMCFLKGTRGPNRFGPDPLAPVSPSTPAASRWDQQSELEFVPHRAGPPAGTHVKRGHD